MPATTDSHLPPTTDELKLVEASANFLAEIADLTPGKSLEAKLNREYGPSSETYQQLAELALRGLRDGWLANQEITGPNYRRSRLRAPSEEQHWLSITAVYMESESEQVFAGQYHAHPYGEINCSIPVPGTGPSPELEGMDGFWVGSGWTCPGPGSHHYPRARGGGLIALFFLPAGRISYNATPEMPQPADPL
ncbi:p-hydroxylaminobenzoate lyase [Mycena alexandri]|uniref:p-hydroxylaminobenzoate lyase n=1 Tax=Mycena alexandri TaxID=1745969 RepID=A0AAD6SUZ2_9AGAR|nr:p-hydroxylaminobenzoate lyase [Mycena alexandri]